jgi:hypothetical protein
MASAAPSHQSIEVTLAVRTPEVISGAALPVVVTLRHTGATGGALVHSPEADSPFIFAVEPESGERFEVSRDLYLQRTRPNPPPPREPEMAPLRAGTSIDYELDLAKFLTSPLRPGRYGITVAYPLRGEVYRSAPVGLRVVAPRVQLLEVAPSGNRLALGAVIVHLDGADTPVLYRRDSESGKPALGSFRAGPSLRQPTSLAISTDGEGATEPRWVGWAEGGNAAFALVWGDATLHTTEPVPIGADARLVSPGWTLDDESVTFLAASPTAFRLVNIRGREAPRVQTYPVNGEHVDPRFVRAAFFKSQQTPTGSRWLVVWADGSRLMGSLINPDVETASAREIARGPEPLVALDIESVARERSPIIQAVFAAPAGQAYLMQVRPGEAAQTLEIPAPPDPGAAGLQWAVLAAPQPAVALRVGTTQILAWRPGGEWVRLYESADGEVTELRLVQLERAWAVWVDSADGVHYRELPG